MKINPIAVATVLPAAMAGIALSVAAPLAQASAAAAPAAAGPAVVRAAHVAAHHVAKPKPKPRTRHHHQHHQAAASGQAQQDATQSTAQSAPQSGPSVTAGESAFEQCVAWRESGDNAADPDGLFGILPSTWAQLGYSGTAGQAPVAVQKVAFDRLYAEYGAQPWAPSDGC